MGSNPGVVLENAMGEIPSLTAVARRLTKLLDDCEVVGLVPVSPQEFVTMICVVPEKVNR